MAESGALINLGDLSKPATVLIEKVSSAVGIIYEPTRIKRKAQAEAEAEKIKTLSRIELSEIEQRALERFTHQEARKQENIEQITAQAIKELPPDAKVQDLDEDWVAHFFKQCDVVSDKEMQSLWSRLLAGEATRPGTYSKMTTSFVSNMGKKDAQLFTTFCQFIWYMDKDLVPLIYNEKDDIYTKHGINFVTLTHLESIGLIKFNTLTGHNRSGYNQSMVAFYYGTPVTIVFPSPSNNVLTIGKVLLTAIGNELAPICGSAQNEEFLKYIKEHWIKKGLKTN